MQGNRRGGGRKCLIVFEFSPNYVYDNNLYIHKISGVTRMGWLGLPEKNPVTAATQSHWWCSGYQKSLLPLHVTSAPGTRLHHSPCVHQVRALVHQMHSCYEFQAGWCFLFILTEILLCLCNEWTPLVKSLHKEHFICLVRVVQGGVKHGVAC